MTATRTIPCENGCGQLAFSADGHPAICSTCTTELAAERAREFSYERLNLFTPAPAVIAGQTHLEGC
jgi:hypothetical protein